jgi:hypothetical protein
VVTDLRSPLKVLITIDTEIWPRCQRWRETQLADEIRSHIYGETRDKDFGIPYQMEVFERHGIKAVFFVEALFATALGLGRLAEITGLIKDRGHEIQLHIHPEWVKWITPPILDGRSGYNLKDFSESDQLDLILRGLDNFRSCGIHHVRAFRAGNYGANNATLRALRTAGIEFDTSYNPAFLDTDCGIVAEDLLLQPVRIEGTYEFPVSSFFDMGAHIRPAQLCACSIGEMQHALYSAWQAGWCSFVIVSHSFELVHRPKDGGLATPRRFVISRFEELCRFLEVNRDRFETVGFNDLDTPRSGGIAEWPAVRGRPMRTAWRLVEQAIGRVC